MKYLTFALMLCFLSCQKFEAEKPDNQPPAVDKPFDSEKWKIAEGEDFPYRAEMLGDLMTTDTLRHKTLDEVKELLGEPSRVNEGYIYYTISDDQIGFFRLHTVALVLRLSKDSLVDKIVVYK